MRKLWRIFDVYRMTLKVKFWHFLTPPYYLTQFSKFNDFLCVCGPLDKNLPNCVPPFKNSTTHIAILYTAKKQILYTETEIKFSCQLCHRIYRNMLIFGTF